MTNGDLDKRIEFIIEQQAQFSADIEVMREVHAADTKLHKEETKLVREDAKLMKEQIRSLNDAVTAVVGMVGRLSEAQERTDATVAQRFAELAAAQERTEERLSIFINVVERHLGGNGVSGSSDRL